MRTRDETELRPPSAAALVVVPARDEEDEIADCLAGVAEAAASVDLPVVVSVDADGTRVVRPAHRRGSASHLVTAPAHADALADVPADLDRVEAGDLVGIRSLS